MTQPDKFPLTKLEIISISLALIIAIAGYILDMYFQNQFFPRFGAIVVCVGVIFGLKDLNATLNESVVKGLQQYLDKQDEAKNQVMDFFDKHTPQPSENDFFIRQELASKLDEGFNINLGEQTQDASTRHEKIKSRVIAIEGSIIIIGTLIWAFGDFLV